MGTTNLNEKTEMKWYKKRWVIIAGIILSPFLITVAPLLLFLVWQRKKEWRTWVKGLITIVPAIWSLVLISIIIDSTQEKNELLRQVEEYRVQIDESIDNSDLVQARGLLKELKELDTKQRRSADKMIQQIDDVISSDYIISTFEDMSDKEFKLLKSGELDKAYVGDERLNEIFLGQLRENTDKKEEMIAAAKEAERKEKEQAKAEEREARIRSQFSAWNGSHINLTDIIKDSMNDPKSYSHDETIYWDMGDHLVVQTTFRGKNAFGGVVKEMVKAKISLDGDVLEIME